MKPKEYKQLERLGDAVLRLIIVEMFIINIGSPVRLKRQSTNTRIWKMQCNSHMSKVAKIMGIEPPEFDKSNKRYANAFEAKLGKVYLHNGLERARSLVRKYNSIYYKEFD